jgi:hypothetical protein
MVVITNLMAWTWHHVFNGSPMCKEVKPDIIFPGAEGRHHRWWFLPKEIRPGSFPSSQRRPRQDPPSSEGTWGPTLSRSRYPGFPRSDMLLLHPRLAHLLHPLTPHVRSTIRSMRDKTPPRSDGGRECSASCTRDACSTQWGGARDYHKQERRAVFLLRAISQLAS